MIAYTPFDFLVQSVLMFFVGCLFLGLLLLAALLVIGVIDWLRTRRKERNRPKIVQFADWHKPGDLEDA